MFVFSTTKEKTFGEIVEIIDWCKNNCHQSFYLSSTTMLNPMAIMYLNYIKHDWPALRDEWLQRSLEPFTAFSLPHFIFDSRKDATLFKLTFAL